MGFFDLDTLPSASTEGKSDHAPKIHGCKRCGLYASCVTPKIPYRGNGKKSILIVGPQVLALEDRSANENPGSTYAYLRKHFRMVGIDLDEDCWYTHAIRCYSKKEPTPVVYSACHRMLVKEIEELDPAIIVPICQEAWDVLLYERMAGRASTASHEKWCGEVIPDQVLKRWIMPIFDPRSVLRLDEKRNNHLLFEWRKSMERIRTQGRRLPPEYELPIQTTTTLKEALVMIETAKGWSNLSFDYETTGIKPYDEGHKISHISISNGEVSYAFPFMEGLRDSLKELLTSPVPKLAHNVAFERSWTKNFLGYDVVNLCQDTMILQHCLNNRKPTGLKFLVYARYGFLAYDADTDDYLKPEAPERRRRGSNAINRIFDAPAQKILRYCAMDSLFTAWLLRDMLLELDSHLVEGYRFFMEVEKAFSRAHEQGIRVDLGLMGRTEQEIEIRIKPYIDGIMNDPIILEGWKSAHKFNPRSDHDLRSLLFGILKLAPKEFTESGHPSVDAEALEEYRGKVSIVEPLYEIKRLSKLGGTYIRQIKAEHNNGTMRCFLNLHKVATYRSSCDSPNLQNQPKRDKKSKEIIRSLYLPRKGHLLKEIDLKGAEVSIAAAITGDANLVKYVSDPSTDMHRDLARSIFFVTDVHKNLRGLATKGPFTFAEFYGSYHVQVAAGMWKEIAIPNAEEVFGMDVVKHLRKCGIKTYEQWEAHIKRQEDILWNQFFPDYKRWREDTYDFFCNHGYIDYPTGFRYRGPATRNECLNAPVQGSAFHVQAWAFTQIDKELEKRRMNSRLVLQVHDSIIGDIDPAEEGIYDKICHKYLIEEVRNHWKWITVPIMAEVERGEVDQPWSKLKGIGFLEG